MTASTTRHVAPAVGYAYARINVSDLEQATAWYSATLGLELVNEWGFPTNDVRFARVRAASGFEIELVQIGGSEPHPRAFGSVPETVRTRGIAHLGLLVDDCDAAVAQLEANGIQLTEGAHDVIEGGIRHAFLHDLDGNTLEIVERLS